jgi:hypothetical protein
MSPTSYQAAPPRAIDITRLAALLQPHRHNLTTVHNRTTDNRHNRHNRHNRGCDHSRHSNFGYLAPGSLEELFWRG